MAHLVGVRFGEFTLDFERRQLFRNEQEIHLAPKAFELLQTLIAHRPKSLAKDELVEQLWPETNVVSAGLTVLVAEVRRALGDDARRPQFIRTAHRHGYAFCGDAVELAGEPAGTGVKRVSRWCLVWRERSFTLTEGENLIGRNPQCAVWLESSGISRRHARILIDGDSAMLEDLGSKNHTYLGGRQLTAPTRIQEGDVIAFGEAARMTFRMWDVKTAHLRVRRSPNHESPNH